MLLTLRPYKDSDYKTLVQWWDAHKWAPVAPQALPKVGYIVELDKPICAGFLYQTDSMIAWCEFIISDPNSNPSDRDKSLDILISSLTNEAKELGFKAIFIAPGTN